MKRLKIGHTIDPELIKRLDELVKNSYKYENRSQAIEIAIMRLLVSEEK